MEEFKHVALTLRERLPIAYTAMSKHYFHMRELVSEFTLEQGYVPLNPFMNFGYFLGRKDEHFRNRIRRGNNSLVDVSDELWSFGPIADGVLVEIIVAIESGKPIKFFRFEKSKDIILVTQGQIKTDPLILVLEDGIADKRENLIRALDL